MKKILIEVKNGTIKVDAQGFKGKTCLEATAFLENLLSESAGARKLKPEFHQEVQVVRQVGS